MNKKYEGETVCVCRKPIKYVYDYRRKNKADQLQLSEQFIFYCLLYSFI